MIDTLEASLTPVEQAVSTRDGLRQAVEAVSAAKEVVARAQGLVERAHQLVAKAQTEYDRSQAVQQDVRAWKFERFKSGSAEPMPPDLAEALHEGIYATQELEHAQAFVVHVTAELETAKANLAATETARVIAANAVTLELSGELFRRLDGVKRERNRLRLVLLGLGDGLEGLMPHETAQIMAPVNQAFHEPEIGMSWSASQSTAAKAFWRGFSEAIREDPYASPGVLPEFEALMR